MKSWNEIRKNAAKGVAVVHCVIVGFIFITETQRHRVPFSYAVRHLSSLCPSAPLPLCVKIILSQSSRDAKTQSLPHAVRHLILSRLSSLCLSASVLRCFIAE